MCLTPAFVHGVEHRLRLFGGARQRLLAEDVLARLRRGDARLGVRVVGAAVVEELDGRVVEHLAPVGVVPSRSRSAWRPPAAASSLRPQMATSLGIAGGGYIMYGIFL